MKRVLIIVFCVVTIITCVVIMGMEIATLRVELASKDRQIESNMARLEEVTTQRDAAYKKMAEMATSNTPITPETESTVEQEKPEPESEVQGLCLGQFKVTHYCTCAICCGTETGLTASGRTAVPGYTIAVDPTIIPLGSVVLVDYGDGELHEYRADDTGGLIKGAIIDVCCADHETACNLGVRYATVYVQDADNK